MRGSAEAALPNVLLLQNVDPDWPLDERAHVLAEMAALEDALREAGHRVAAHAVEHADLAEPLAAFDPARWIVLNLCEALPGMPRSEADVAALLEECGFAFTGSDAAVLTLSWDKVQVKRRLAEQGVPTPAWCLADGSELESWNTFPAIVKPAGEHASVGLTRDAVVMNRDALYSRVARMRAEHGSGVLVEDFVDGREFHVSVWGNGRLHVLPPAEMDFTAFSDPRDRLCSWDAKFTPGSRQYEGIELLLPAPLSRADSARLAAVARAASRAVGCRDYARIDVRLRDGVFYVLDVNPNCDLSTDTSTALAAAQALGSYGALLSRLVSLAAARHGPYVNAG